MRSLWNSPPALIKKTWIGLQVKKMKKKSKQAREIWVWRENVEIQEEELGLGGLIYRRQERKQRAGVGCFWQLFNPFCFVHALGVNVIEKV